MKKQNIQEEPLTTITVKLSTRKKLNMWKYNLNCKNIDEVIDRILKIIPASELKGFQKQ
jgi:hypothetical protein